MLGRTLKVQMFEERMVVDAWHVWAKDRDRHWASTETRPDQTRQLVAADRPISGTRDRGLVNYGSSLLQVLASLQRSMAHLPCAISQVHYHPLATAPTSRLLHLGSSRLLELRGLFRSAPPDIVLSCSLHVAIVVFTVHATRPTTQSSRPKYRNRPYGLFADTD